MHEHQRPDRDEYIDIDWKKAIMNSNLWKIPKAFANSMCGKYDYNSIMHYPAHLLDCTIKKNFKPERINDKMTTMVGQMEGLSQTDIDCIKNLYGK